MRLYKSILIITTIVVISLMLLEFTYALNDILVHNGEYDLEDVDFATAVTILTFVILYRIEKFLELLSNMFYIRKYSSKNSFGMKRDIKPKNINELMMSSTFYYSFCEYIEIDLDVNIIDSNYLFFTIYEDEQLVLYYEPRSRRKKIMEVISNG